MFQGWKRSGLAFLSALLFLVAPILLLPYSAVFLLFVSASLTNLLAAFALYPVIEQKTVLLEKEEGIEEVDQNSGDQYLQSATFTGWDDEDSAKQENQDTEKQEEQDPAKQEDKGE